MTEKEITYIERVILDHCYDAGNIGFRVGYLATWPEGGCPFSAVAAVRKISWLEATEFLGLNGIQLLSFARGFDRETEDIKVYRDVDFYAMGQRFRTLVKSGEFRVSSDDH